MRLSALEPKSVKGGGGGGADCCRALARLRFSTMLSMTSAPRFLPDFGGLMTSCGFGAMKKAMSSRIVKVFSCLIFGRNVGKAWFEDRGRAWTVTVVRGLEVAGVVVKAEFWSSSGGEECGGVAASNSKAGSWLMAP